MSYPNIVFVEPTKKYVEIHERSTLPSFDEKTFWGYTVDVMNYAEDEEGKSYGGDLCAINDKSGDPAKLNVAPCFLPTSFAGPYWVLAYDESEGYALIVGGQPTQVTSDGLCIPSEGVNESGLWTSQSLPPSQIDFEMEQTHRR